MYDTNMQLWNEVRRAVLGNGVSQTQACQQFNIHSDTLKRILAHSEPPGYQRSKLVPPAQSSREKPKIEPFIPIIREILENDRNVPVSALCSQKMSNTYRIDISEKFVYDNV